VRLKCGIEQAQDLIFGTKNAALRNTRRIFVNNAAGDGTIEEEVKRVIEYLWDKAFISTPKETNQSYKRKSRQ
jgi:hypothetical protein